MRAVHITFLARGGITGPPGTFEGPLGYFELIKEKAAINWSKEGLNILPRTSIKKFNGELHSQAAIKAAVELQKEHQLPLNDLHEHPECVKKLQENDLGYLDCFVQEVRRFYPFAPFMGALVREDFEWQGYQFEKGKLVLLDIFGTNHDGQLWECPEEFLPERFSKRKENEFDFIPQGGGNVHSGHRCPGEKITVETTKIAVDFLVRHMQYEVPSQNLSYSLQRMPTFPESGFRMTKIRPKDL